MSTETPTDDEPTVRPYGRRVVTTRRVEFVVPTSGTSVTLNQLQRVVAHASLWLSTEHPDVDQAGLEVRYGSDGALVVACDLAGYASPDASTTFTDVVADLRFQLGEALDAPDDETWDELLDVVRNRSALTRVAARAVSAVTGGTGEHLVLALLPRDWPRRLDQQVTSAGNMLGLVGLVKRLVDDWVLAATDVVDGVDAASIGTTS